MSMTIGIIDADLLGRQHHNFPNLVCEKISGYYKDKGAKVDLLSDYNGLDFYDSVFISKVFTDTPVPEWLMTRASTKNTNIHLGGTGFYADSNTPLPHEIEHHMPDYHLYDLYDAWSGRNTKAYSDYSIGFMTRGCFRHCDFCVNKKYNWVTRHSPLNEFYDPARNKICLLDDNVFGYSGWKKIFEELISTDKPFVFKQGLDIRLLTEEKVRMLLDAKYEKDFIFAFDNIGDYDLIAEKLRLLNKYGIRWKARFYVLVGYVGTDITDIYNMWLRVRLLMQHGCLPYIMRYQNKDGRPCDRSIFKGIYTTMAQWCNQPSFFKKKTFREYCMLRQEAIKTEGGKCVAIQSLEYIEQHYPNIAQEFFDLRYDSF